VRLKGERWMREMDDAVNVLREERKTTSLRIARKAATDNIH
jgi:hypothetical protein